MKENGPSKKPLCFVVGPIGKDGTTERKHSDLLLNAVIKQVLKATEFGYDVRRADEDADPGMIGDRVVSDIINADLVIADLTDLNANVFYELGIRHSTEKPTIHIARYGTALPFDNVAHRTIFVDLTDWDSIEQSRAKLADSARAIKAPEYRVSNPITQANASFKMRQSEDPRDQIVAELQSRLVGIENRIGRDLRLKERDVEISTRSRLSLERDIFERLVYHARMMIDKGADDAAITMSLDDIASEFLIRPSSIRLDNRRLIVQMGNSTYEAAFEES